MDGDIGLASEDVDSPSPSGQPAARPEAAAEAKRPATSPPLDTQDIGDISEEQAAPVVDADDEPVPLDTQQVELDEHPDRSSTSAHDAQDQDVSDGAWSSAVAPQAEQEKALGVDSPKESTDTSSHSENEAAAKRPSHLHHARIESLPPQKFADPSHDAGVYDDGHPYSGQRRPSHLDTMEEEIDLDAGDQGEQLEHLSEFERAGLDFVDINLDGDRAAAAQNRIYGPGSMAASKSRTSLEIRTDFVSSDGRMPPPLPSADGEQSASSSRLKFWRKNSNATREDEAPRAAEPSSPPPPPTPSKTPTASYDDTPSISTDSLSRSRPVEGRYRGKLSRPASPAHSPILAKRGSSLFGEHSINSLPPESPRSSLPSGMTMMVANEDGEVEVVSVGDVPGAAAGDPEPPQPPSPDNLAPPEPKANTNESQDAIDSKARELSAVAATEAPPSSQQPAAVSAAPSARGGRSAGPSAVGLDEEANTDVRPETAAEAAAKQAAATPAGGRSAGPIIEGEEGSEASKAPATPTTPATPTPKSGGRSAGPLLTSFVSPISGRKGHARKPSNTPSALEKHVSRTRMTTLPPKARTEDQRHLRDFEIMMKEFKAAEAKKAKEDEERQRRKEEELRVATQIWEDEILKDWRVARTNTRLRAVWWKGCPPSLRGRAWQLAIGNAQMLPRNLFTTTKARIAEFKSKGQWPPKNALFADPALAQAGLQEEDVSVCMDADIERTLPSLKLFQKEIGPMHDDLREVLECLVLLRADQAEEMRLVRERDRANGGAASPAATSPKPRQVARVAGQHRRTESLTSEAPAVAQLYVPGLALLCATLLLNLSQSETLVGVLNLIHSKPWLRSIYSMDPIRLRESEAFERVLNTLLADQLPKVYANMQAQGVRPSAYARDWIRNLFVPLLPFDAVCRLWDNIFLEESDSLLFRTCLALVSLLSSRLYVPDAAELTSILQGKNRAALSVWYRFLQTAPPGSPLPGSPGAEHAASPSPLAMNFKDQASVQAIASLPNSPLATRHRNYKASEEELATPSAAQAPRSALAGAPSQSDADDREGEGEGEDGDDGSPAAGHAGEDAEQARPSSSPPSPGEASTSTPSPPNEAAAQAAPASPSGSGTGTPNGKQAPSPSPHPTANPSPSPNAIEAPDTWVPRDALFTVYAIGEEDVFRALEEQVGGWDLGDADSAGAGAKSGRAGAAQGASAAGEGAAGARGANGQGWWKESTLERLVDRELGG